MSIYVLHSEPELTAPADADEIPIYDASAKAIKRITLSSLQATLNGGTPIAVTAATLELSRATHAGRLVTLSRAGGIDVTLPAATGSGDVYEFIILADTTDAYAFAVTGNDTIAGHALADDGDGEPANGWASKTATSVSLGGASQATGGSIGDRVIFRDVAADKWACSVFCMQGGTEATPFA